MPDYARYSLCGFLGALTVPHAISHAVNRTLSAAPSADRRDNVGKSRDQCIGVDIFRDAIPVDAKSLRDLEVMKSCHDVTSIVIEESFGLIRERYSIPEEYVLRASLPEQWPYNPKSIELNILVDTLEAGLRFPLHPTIVDCLRWWRISSS
ncbi:hypothetical protein BHE74_00046322 [Ensete ventricosum]|nr:hypothetical protein BHE74_00046322 [Ensete ventricosum]